MIISEVYKEALYTDKKVVFLKSGRNAGKSKFMAQMVVLYFLNYPNNDIMVTRSVGADLITTMFQEIMNVFAEEDLEGTIEFKKRPFLVITHKHNNNQIHFRGIGGSDLSRTKGNVPPNKFSLFVVDELQQLPSQANLDQARATFRRNFLPFTKTLYSFNPEPQNSHWCNEFFRISEQERDDFYCLHTSYLDIKGFLTSVDLDEIELERKHNFDYYRYLYLGETNGLFGTVYSSFDRHKHLISPDKVDEIINKIGIDQLLVGIDSAVTRDKTAVIPILVLRNGQTIVLEYFYHDPERDRALPDEQLSKYIFSFLREIEKKYRLDFPRKNIHLIIDSANANLVQTLQYNDMYKRYRIWAYSQKRVIEMARIVQDAFSKNVVYVLDNNGTYNYLQKRMIKEHPLVTALESVIWDENGKGFDPKVPNDTTDALTYALATYFKNPHNLDFPSRAGYYEVFEEKKEEIYNE